MRFAVFALTCLGVGGLALAAADPTPATQPEPAAAPAAVATDVASLTTSAATEAPAPPAASPPAASQPAAPKAATAALSADEQRLLNQGYKPQMRNGEKVYCRREAVVGSRINFVQYCGTVSELRAVTQNSRDIAEKTQRTQASPMGH